MFGATLMFVPVILVVVVVAAVAVATRRPAATPGATLPPALPPAPRDAHVADRSAQERLAEAEDLRRRGLITADEFGEIRQRILDGL